ncbi:MAG TPA: A/G-specific adenine glycosylase, partial [Paracoccaceae bacterium]|nr:A/G-specific adenine glycosylase [Paracoccaceae bacterium]
MDKKAISPGDKLLDWYDGHRRTLPWRVEAGSVPDPYRVWLSEVMLQQTTTAAVAPYFGKFTRRWPTVEALAAAPEDEVMAAWAGLGYYSRARNLVLCARAVVVLGGFPQSEADLRKLPGLGAYTAAAVAAIAFGQRAVVIDANVERVVARLFAIEELLPAAR